MCDQGGGTAILDASANGHLDIVEFLLQAKADPNIAERRNGETALYAASASGHANVVDMLLRSGAGPNIKTTRQGSAPCHIAAERNHIEVVIVLLNSSSVNLNTQGCTQNQPTALHLAAKWGFSEIVALLLAAKGQVQIQTSKLQMKGPLHST